VLQIADLICGFADLARPAPDVAAVAWIPACAGMTVMRCVRELDYTSKAGTQEQVTELASFLLSRERRVKGEG